jgi:hypothetical protein
MRPDPLPASFAQARLWLVEQIDGPMCRYVIPLTLRLDGRLDNAALWAALDDVVARHESLRTLLKTGADGTPLQEIVAATEAHVERVVEVVTRDELDERLSVYASRPFHLDREFPLRAVLLSLEDADEEQVLLLSLHHSAADGWSLTPLMEDLANAYAARKVGHPPNLVPLPIQYGDYAQWQAALLGERDVSHSLMANQLVWWQQQLIDLPEEIALPTDHQRAEHSVAEGGRVRFELSQILHARLLEFARQEGASLFMVLLTGLVLRRCWPESGK